MAKRKTAAPATDTLLVELLTEELPPKSLRHLGQAFADEVFNGLVRHQLKLRDFSGRRVFATPRRLAVLVPDVLAVAESRSNEITGPSVVAPPEAVTGFAKKHGLAVGALEQRDTPKGPVFVARVTIEGASLDAVLSDIVNEAVKKLPIPKVMRWGSGDAQFVRPVHGLVMMHGKRVVPGEVLNVASGKATLGHRFLGAGRIAIDSADRYEAALDSKGRIVADFAKRRERIRAKLEDLADGATMVCDDPLLDEITALVEWPAVYEGEFAEEFLEVPPECLILSMQQHQKYVPLRDRKTGRLLPRFLFVSNVGTKDPREIVHGNERVLRARLSDAKFFFDQDRKTPLAERVPQLAKVVYHNKLGSQLDRVKRLESTARQFAGILKGEHIWGADEDKAKSATYLAKADLLTGMVGEFPELQGIMGAHYARHEGVNPEIAQAIEDHYLPRFSGDRLPLSTTGVVVALVDKLDSLFGMFGIGQIPTGEKDPFALRRQALGVIRLLVEKQLPLDLEVLFRASEDALRGHIASGVSEKVYEFLLDRLRGYLKEQGYEANEIESVLALSPKRLDHVLAMLSAVRAFKALPEAQSLAAANKRIRNIIHKSNPPTRDMFLIANLKEPAERALYDAFKGIDGAASTHLSEGRYKEALLSLAALKNPVDAFFDTVMVNVDDQALRNNRLLLLMQLDSAMNRVADISKLAVEK